MPKNEENTILGKRSSVPRYYNTKDLDYRDVSTNNSVGFSLHMPVAIQKRYDDTAEADRCYELYK